MNNSIIDFAQVCASGWIFLFFSSCFSVVSPSGFSLLLHQLGELLLLLDPVVAVFQEPLDLCHDLGRAIEAEDGLVDAHGDGEVNGHPGAVCHVQEVRVLPVVDALVP